MAEDEQSVMIALLPITDDWCKIELPHMTLVYAGELPDLSATNLNDLCKDASALAALRNTTLYVKVMGIQTLGGGVNHDPQVDVLCLQPTPELMAMRRYVEHWNASEFPFKPHCTIGPTGQYLENKPSALAFDRIMVAWGKEQLVFNFRR